MSSGSTRLALRLGMQREQEFVDAIGCGNGDLSAGLTTFWLGSRLTNSADKQVQFLNRLRRGELPVPPRSLSLTASPVSCGRAKVRLRLGTHTVHSGFSFVWKDSSEDPYPPLRTASRSRP